MNRMHEDSLGSPGSSHVTNQSGEPPIIHRGHSDQKRNEERPDSNGSFCISVKSDQSKEHPLFFKQGQSAHSIYDQKSSSNQTDKQEHKDLESKFLLLEENIISFVKHQLKRFKAIFNQEDPDSFENTEYMTKDEDEVEHRRSSEEAVFKLTLNFLRIMKEDKLVDSLQIKHPINSQTKVKAHMKRKFQYLFEGIAKQGQPTLLKDIFTELYIINRGTTDVSCKHEVGLIEAANRTRVKSEATIRCNDIFKSAKNHSIRTVLTTGVAGIGKTVLTQKFTLDWAEDKANQDIHFIFPFTFRELNLLKEKHFSLVELVHYFFTETKEAGICNFDGFQVVFIFDGLDECQLSLDFRRTEILTDATKSTTVQVLLTNLIRGKLLPCARLWITTRPAAANHIPPDCVHMVTEVQGFSDPQKEEYFRMRFRPKEQANRIISHIKSSQSLHIMCHIPVFCWITATVLEAALKSIDGGALPQTLTEMYIHFLVVHTKLSNVKFHGGHVMDPHWNSARREMILSLGKLAFENLQKGNLIFYESDLIESGIDMEAALVYSGVLMQIFKEERALYQHTVFCFVHLSVQEFLAALYVDLTFSSSGRILLVEDEPAIEAPNHWNNKLFYESAVDKALESPNGHLDLFLRFLLGLSVESNRSLLQGLVTGNNSTNSQETAKYIKEKIKLNQSTEKCINLFHCLSELRDQSLVEQVQHFLNSERLSTEELSHAQWSALVFILLSSEEYLEEFDLNKYCATEEAFLHLLPVIKASRKCLLTACNLGRRCCDALAPVLSSASSNLKELDLSNNNLQDFGVKFLCEGLKNPNCKLEILRLSGCLITHKGCEYLASALSSNPSHLRELDLSYNHPGDLGMKLLSVGLQDSQWRLETLRLDPGGEQWLKPGLKKYACELTLDPNTANNFVLLSDDNTQATVVSQDQCYADHADRFQPLFSAMCQRGLTGRSYWEVEREGWLAIAVMYRHVKRKGDSKECRMGRNKESWALFAADDFVSAWHDDRAKTIYVLPYSLPKRVAVYLDWEAGTVSFYRKTPEALTHLHTFYATFTECLYPGFAFRTSSSVRLCQVTEDESNSADGQQSSHESS